MKVHGSYYKNTNQGKKKMEFELEVKESDLLSMKKEASDILLKNDQEFRGIREFFIDDHKEKAQFNFNPECIDPITYYELKSSMFVQTDDGLYSLKKTDEDNVFAIDIKVEDNEKINIPLEKEIIENKKSTVSRKKSKKNDSI